MFAEDCRACADFWRLSEQLLARLPQKSARNPVQTEAASSIHRKARDTRERFLRRHVEAVYATVTQGWSRFVRVEQLVLATAEAFPGLVPTRRQLDAEA